MLCVVGMGVAWHECGNGYGRDLAIVSLSLAGGGGEHTHCRLATVLVGGSHSLSLAAG